MGKLVVTNHVSLDGVMQAAAGRPEQHGGHQQAITTGRLIAAYRI